jgi:hypothetical protein
VKLLPALFLLLWCGAAHAAPLCVAPARHPASIVPVNEFAENPPPRAIVPGRGNCGWGVGLAMSATGTGTAYIIGNRREVITSLHVVDKNCRGRRTFIFNRGYDRGRVLGRGTATVVAHGEYCAVLKQQGRHEYGGDWAIAVLDRDPSARAGGQALPAPLPADGDWRAGNGNYTLLGYAMSFRRGMVPYTSASCRFSKLFGDGVVEHDCDAGPRASGAPIVDADSVGACRIAAIHVGEIAHQFGRPRYRDDVNANVAVLASQFAAAARAVARDLDDGLDTNEIAADLAAHPPR